MTTIAFTSPQPTQLMPHSATVSITSPLPQVTPFNGVMTLVTTGCNVSTVPCPGFMYYSSTALPTSSSGTFNLAAPGLVQSMPSPGNFLMGATSNVMYFGADATIAGSGLYRWNSVTGTIAGTYCY